MIAQHASAAEILLCAAAAAPNSTRNAGGEWRTLARVPTIFAERGKFVLQIRYAPSKGAQKAAQRSVRSDALAGYNTSWVTRAAAELVRPDFKAWVNSGMHTNQSKGAVAQLAARGGTAAARMVASRFSSRQQGPGAKVLNTLTKVAAMAVAMGQPGMQITQAALVERWTGDNVDWQARAKARRARAVDMQRVKIPDAQWEQCRCADAVQMCLTRNSAMRVSRLVCVVELYLALVELYFNKMLADSLNKKSLREQYVQLLL